MNITQIIRLIVDNIKFVFSVSIILGASIFLATRDQPKIYETSSTIYTGIATGYTIESGNGGRFDFLATNTKFDNFINIIKSRQIHEETAIRLLANHLYENEKTKNKFKHLSKLINDKTTSVLIDTNSLENSILNVRNYSNLNDTNVVYKLLRSKNEFYSIEQISKTNVQRLQNSDLITLSYEAQNPLICQQTVEVLTEAFLEKYNLIQSSQTSSVVAYFEERVAQALKRLDEAEEQLLGFREENRIINYYEQTKFIAEKKEDLDEEYQQELKMYAASKAALENIEANMNNKANIYLHSDQIIEKRKRLSYLTQKITKLRFSEPDEVEAKRLEIEAEKLKLNLKDEINALYLLGHSKEGLPVESVLEQWLESVIKVEESGARIEVVKEGKKQFYKKYDTFAPLGSKLKRIEREIDIAEKEYLNLLHHLNLAKLKEQNNLMSSNVKILDKPFYPLKAKKSSRTLLVLIGLIAGFVLSSGLLIFMEFVDNTIKTPERVKQLIGKGLLGVYPNISRNIKNVDIKYIDIRLIEIIIQKIKLKVIKRENKNEKPYFVLVSSSRKEEGKSFMSKKIINKLMCTGKNVLFIKPEDDSSKFDEKKYQNKLTIKTHKIISKIAKPFRRKQIDYFNNTPQDIHTIEYKVDSNFFDITCINDLIQDSEFKRDNYNYIILELPALLRSEFPSELASKADLSILVTRSNRTWNKADEEVLKLFNNTLTNDILVILNGLRVEFLESIIGEIPKRRSWIRKLGKRIVKLDFSSKNNL